MYFGDDPALGQTESESLEGRPAEGEVQECQVTEPCESLEITQVGVSDSSAGEVKPLQVVEFSETGKVLLVN